MRDLTVGQLRELLERFDDDQIISMATQPEYPLRLAVWDSIVVVEHVAYLRTSEHPYDVNPYAPRAAFADEDALDDALPCEACGDPAEGAYFPPPDGPGLLPTEPEPLCRRCARANSLTLSPMPI